MITDILLDVNVVIDFCAGRTPYQTGSLKALDKALQEKVRVWLYTGCVQTLEYVLAGEIRRAARDKQLSEIGIAASHSLAKSVLETFSRDKQWLAALSEDGDVWSAQDPEDRQLCNAVLRLGNNARLLTRDEELARGFSQAITPEDYLNLLPEKAAIPFIDLAEQQDRIRPTLENRVYSVLRHGQYILGPQVRELEQKLAAYVGTKHAVGCASGTDALLMALMAYGIGPGDAVFTTPFTFIATAEVICLLGATPVFVDIDPVTFNIDPARLDLAIRAIKADDSSLHPLPRPLSPNAERRTPNATKLTPRGIIPVDLFGLPADYDAINRIAGEHGLFVIEDAAQSFGAEYRGRKACSLADIACTSFFPAKPLGGYGDGGMCFTDDDRLAESLRSIGVHGKGSHRYDNVRVGINGRLDTLQAAVLIAKFDLFQKEIQLRDVVANLYAELINASNQTMTGPLLTIPKAPTGYESVWAQYSLLAKDEEHRSVILKSLQENKIPAAIYYPIPLHRQTAFAQLDYGPGSFPISEDAAQRIFSLPMHPYLKVPVQEKIVQAIFKGH